MRIVRFHGFLEHSTNNNEVVLNNSSLVIDGHNFFYRLYKESNLCSLFGSECNSYAKYVKEQLRIFQKANVKCYFLFKGGNKAESDILVKLPFDEYKLNDYTTPPFSREVNKEVLNDMGFDYAICEYTSKEECVALAQRLNCPVLSLDIEIFFYGAKYIPYFNLDYNERTNVLQGKFFKLDQLKEKFHLHDQQIALFIVIFGIYSLEFQETLLRKLRLPLAFRCRYEDFFRWLSANGQLALEIIAKLVTNDENMVIRLEFERIIQIYSGMYQRDGLIMKYFLNKSFCSINRCDQEWFAKGVLWKFIAIPYIDVYRHGIFKGSWSSEDLDAEDSLLLSAQIVRYGFDLLTNFNNEKLIFIGRCRNRIEHDSTLLFSEDGTIEIRPTIRKPDYGPSNLFENGWEDVSSLQLFEHFLKESIQIDMNVLLEVPAECRLLIVALVYFARRKRVDVDTEAYAVLLSYVMLGVVDGAAGIDSTLDDEHCKLAKALMDGYFFITVEEATCILDSKLLHPLVEFQHCLRHLNFLNTLCGSSLVSTVYSKTYNATFAYKVLYDIKRHFNGDGRKFLDRKLKDVPTVLTYVKNLFNIFNKQENKKRSESESSVL